MKKAILINDIISAISELNDLGEGNSSALLLYGDASSETAVNCVKGNPVILATAFGNQMDKSPEFNRLMMSLFGAYLANNQDKKQIFLSGLELTDFPHNLN